MGLKSAMVSASARHPPLLSHFAPIGETIFANHGTFKKEPTRPGEVSKHFLSCFSQETQKQRDFVPSQNNVSCR